MVVQFKLILVKELQEIKKINHFTKKTDFTG